MARRAPRTCATLIAVRPLYPKIPHLPGSRTGPSDRHADPGLVRRCLELGHVGDEVIVQEKLDGSCVAIVREGGRLIAFGREGGRADASRNEGRLRFAAWVGAREAELAPLLGEGERLVGEWLALVHSTHYELGHPPFVPFDLFDREGAPLGLDALQARLAGSGLVTPALLHRGGPIRVEDALARLGERGRHGAVEPAEGLVWRVERQGRVAARAKFVRPGKVDGIHLPDRAGRPARWNIPEGGADPRQELMHGWLRRLARSPARSRLILRGSLITARWWPARRADDLDLLDLEPWDEAALRRLARDITASADDETSFHEVGEGLIWADTPRPGLRLTLRGVAPAGPATLQVDIGFGDPLAAPPEPFSHGGAEVLAVRPEVMVAWKTHGLFELGPRGRWRPKDLLDLVELLARAPLEREVLREALALAFRSRDTPLGDLRAMVRDPTWGASRGSVRKWARFCRDQPGAPEDLAGLLARARAALAPLVALLAEAPGA